MDEMLSALRELTSNDRALVANVVGDYVRHIDDDEGDDADARKRAYIALAAFIRAGKDAHDPS